MAGKIIGTIITLAFMTFMVFLISFYFLHMSIKENVNDLNFSISETIATSGIFTRNAFDYLKEDLGRFGDYMIKLKLDKQIKPGIYDTYFNENEIIDKKLRVGDRVSIYLEDRNPSLFGRLINAAFLGHKPRRFIETGVKSVKTAVVSKNASNLVKGYEVINDIKTKLADPNVAIFVATKLNTSGKFYNIAPHQDSSQVNPSYGDEPDESGNTGINYIFDNGDFSYEVVRYPSDAIRLIKYIQQ